MYVRLDTLRKLGEKSYSRSTGEMWEGFMIGRVTFILPSVC